MIGPCRDKATHDIVNFNFQSVTTYRYEALTRYVYCIHLRYSSVSKYLILRSMDAEAQFIQATGANSATARRFLAQSNGDVARAIQNYRQQYSSSSRVVTLSDLSANGSEQPQLFAGGERSALAVTNPDAASGLVDSILRKAKSGSGHSAEPPSAFGGSGTRLGSFEDEGEAATDDQPAASPELPVVERTLYFWRNGFSIDDGPLYSLDDPANAVYLRAINQGRAPLALLNVANDQAVDVRIQNRPDEDYVQPVKPPSLDNAGEGRRLGSVDPSSDVPNPNATNNTPSLETTTTNNLDTITDANSDADCTVQIRLIDGSRHKVRVNSKGPVQQLYDYCDRINTAHISYILQTSFPKKRLEDHDQSLADAQVVNAVVVQLLI